MLQPVDATRPACCLWVFLMMRPPPPSVPSLSNLEDQEPLWPRLDMEDYDVRSAASILASVKEQEARFEQLTRALEEERRNVNLQLERANLPPNPPTSQPLPWQQVVIQVNVASLLAMLSLSFQPQTHATLCLVWFSTVPPSISLLSSCLVTVIPFPSKLHSISLWFQTLASLSESTVLDVVQ